MAKENINFVKLGVFVMASLVLFTIGVYKIGSKENLFSSVIKVNAIFKNIKGLQTGNVVRYSGINVGSVSDIRIMNDTMIQVEMRIRSELKLHMKKDASAYIGSNGLVGDKVVNILPGASSLDNIESGDLIPTLDQVETEELISSLDQTNKNILLISENILEITNEISRGEGLVANLISNKKMTDDISATLHHLKSTTSSLAKSSRDMELTMQDIQNGKGIIGYLLKDTTLALKIDDLFVKMDTQFIDKTNPILAELNRSTSNMASFTFTMDSLINEIDLQKGVLGLLLKDTLATEQTHQVLDQAIIGADKFNENMEALKHNFLLRRYFKKQEKQKRKEEEKRKKELNKVKS